jgi:hypothetical protein
MKKVYSFRQSDLESADKCLEALRRKYKDPIEEPYTTDLARGNAVHNAIELIGNRMIDSNELVDWEEAQDIIESHIILELMKVDEWRTPRDQTEDTIRNNFESWYWEVLPSLQPKFVEKEFNVLLDETEDRKIYLTGTIDWIDESGLIVDWKNPSRPYQRWEKVRWDNQSTVYTYAVASMEKVFESRPFQLVMLCNGKIHTIEIVRGPNDWNALKAKCHALADLIDANLQSWSDCRGKYLGDDPEW